jgi:hypothetical protein
MPLVTATQMLPTLLTGLAPPKPVPILHFIPSVMLGGQTYPEGLGSLNLPIYWCSLDLGILIYITDFCWRI